MSKSYRVTMKRFLIWEETVWVSGADTSADAEETALRSASHMDSRPSSAKNLQWAGPAVISEPSVEHEGARDHLHPLTIRTDPPNILPEKNPFAIVCEEHDRQYLTIRQYNSQLGRPNTLWLCPVCGCTAEWDDLNYATKIDAWEAAQ